MRMLIYTWLTRKSFSNRSSFSTRKFWHGTNSWNLVQHIPMKTIKSQTYQKESPVVFCFFCFFFCLFSFLHCLLLWLSAPVTFYLLWNLILAPLKLLLIEMLMWPFEMQDSPRKGWRQRLLISWMNQGTGCCLKSSLYETFIVHSRALEVSV